MELQRFNDFERFWPYYLKEHSKAGTRALHFVGTALLLIFLFGAVYFSSFLFLIYGIITAYVFAWIGHFLIEKNRPATFRYPFFSLVGDFKMFGLIVSGRIGSELRRLGIEKATPRRA